MSDRVRYNLYLSDLVWAELKRHVVLQPGQDASRVAEQVLLSWLDDPHPLTPFNRDEWESPGKRSIYLHPDTWQRANEKTRTQNLSVSKTVETLLRDFLGLTKKQ